ncbi:hypothetical protein DEU56DRAFT_795802 [Suillus clintonianus]|uniref:uncharacterized protein n=1 Tax=Suillus clintonianus TaxID=1904413 RepID=UPI001B862CB9|nr:uncharacterized protein DEU56DRAFT_795802 [Suillus clintonianus]KAG2141972.1 hypothetical protein DEU56DRAFT_795802 [Suillus clintonianus]
MPDLEPPVLYSGDPDHSVMRTGQSVSAIIADDQHHSMTLHEGLGPAVSRLPVELLSDIFMYILPPFYEALVPSKLRSPMLLTRLCRRWREVAVDMPCLWCRLSIGYMSKNQEHWQREAFRYNTWLERSQGLPLSLALMWSLYRLTDLLQPYTNQILSLRIDIYCTAIRDLLLNNLPALQELTIFWNNHNFGIERTATAQSILRRSFTLRSLKMVGRWFMFRWDDFNRFASFKPGWHHLTHIEITLTRLNVLPKLLQQGPNLSSARILIAGCPIPIPIPPYTHTKLQSLHISSSGSITSIPDLSDLLNALTLPNLHELTASCSSLDWCHEVFKAFLARSKCPLESLAFGDPYSRALNYDREKAEYFMLIPSLEVVVSPPSVRHRLC